MATISVAYQYVLCLYVSVQVTDLMKSLELSNDAVSYSFYCANVECPERAYQNFEVKT